MYGITTNNNSLISRTKAQLQNSIKTKPNNAATPNVVQAESVKTPKTNSSGDQASRQALNNMGFNDADIGWDGNRVTYKGRGIVQPASVEDGMSYAPESVNNAGAVDWLRNNGYHGIRKGLNDRGITDDRIGWNDGQILVDGRAVGSAQYNVDGTTYGTEDEINALARQAYENSGDNLVAPRDYAASKNHSGIVDWDGENVLVGGQAVKPVYVKDGTAYIRRSDMDRLIGDYESNSGVVNNQSIVDENEAKYGAQRDAALATLQNRKEFSWDPETDESWQRHTDTQMALADDAYRRVLNENNTSVAGASGAVLAEALAAKNNYLDRLSEDEMTWRQNAYDEYAGETDRLRNQFSDLYFAANDELDKRYTANRDNYNDSRTAYLDERDEKWNWIDYDLRLRQDDRDALRAILENDSLLTSNAKSKFDYGISHASALGKFLPEHEQYIPWLSAFRDGNGGYTIGPWDGERLYTQAIAYSNALGQYSAYRDAYK